MAVILCDFWKLYGGLLSEGRRLSQPTSHVRRRLLARRIKGARLGHFQLRLLELHVKWTFVPTLARADGHVGYLRLYCTR